LTDIICHDDDCDLYFVALLDSYKIHNFIIKIETNDNIINPKNLRN